MRYRCLLLWGLLVCTTSALPAQKAHTDSTHSLTVADWRFRKIVGFNMTPLVTQLIPFNRSSPRLAGPYLIRFKRYGATGKRAFRFSLGLTTATPDDVDTKVGANLGFGWEKRRGFARRWTYTRGFDIALLLGNNNLPDFTTTGNAILALGPLWGLEYTLAPRITLGTETSLLLGVNAAFEFLPVFQVVPPVGLFLHYYL